MAAHTALLPSANTSASAFPRAAFPSAVSLAPAGGHCCGLHRHSHHAAAPTLRTCREHPRTVVMGLKAVETFDTSFELNPEAKEVLEFLLSADTFCEQVASQPGVPEGVKVEYTGELFQPVPWSVNTKHGMPQEYEKYLHDKENYAIINVPPNFMFKAQVFKPSRLCAIYRFKRGGEGSE